MCFGYNIKQRSMFLVHNGETQENISQPVIWAQASRPWDTFKTEHKWDRTGKTNPMWDGFEKSLCL